LTLASALVLVACAVVASLRWLRVAQFEHYLPGSTTRFMVRWFRSSAVNSALGIATVRGRHGCVRPRRPGRRGCSRPRVAIGLGLRGRTRRLQWTRRLRTLAAVDAGLLALVFGVVTALTNAKIGACVTALAIGVLVDTACAITRPIEDRLSLRFVRQATTRLHAIAPRVIAITGSFGKTSTKEHLRDIVGTARTVVASPASFNNRAGLSRTILEHLVPGTQILVAEMGMYGPGEIADLSSWIQPEIAVITAIAPVHLDGSARSTHRRGQREILVGAKCAILNVDCAELADLAREIETAQRVVRVGSVTDDADVVVRRDGQSFTIRTPPERSRRFIDDPGVEPTNLACAVAVALEIGVDLDTIRRGLAALQSPAHAARRGLGRRRDRDRRHVQLEHRRQRAGAACARRDGERSARRRHARHRRARPPAVRREQGARRGRGKGRRLGRHRRATNRSALRSGTRQTTCESVEVRHREDAVAWVRSRAERGDVVLYENDLPDHYRDPDSADAESGERPGASWTRLASATAAPLRA